MKIYICVQFPDSDFQTLIAYKLGFELQLAGVHKCVVYGGDKNLDIQLELAAKYNYLVALIRYPEQLANNTILIKDLKTGSTEEVPYHEIITRMRKV